MKRRQCAAALAVLLMPVLSRAGNARISWVVAEAPAAIQSLIQPDDKKQAEEIYLESLALIEERMMWRGSPLRPRITVHIGEACPATEMDGPCMNPALGVLYVNEWNEEARRALAHITMLTAMQQMLEPGERQRLI